jgi:hemerythrin
MALNQSALDRNPFSTSKIHEQIEYRIKGRILHTLARGPFTQLVAAIPANINDLLWRLAQQGKWGQIIVFEHSALISADALAEFSTYIKQRYANPENNPVTALVLDAEVEGARLMAPGFLECYRNAGVQSRVFEDYSTALEWVESSITQFSPRIEWKDSYNIGDPAIDEQHQELFKRANYVIAATSHEGQVISAMRLFQYLRTHLSHEEDLMYRLQYPDFAAHTKMHQELISRLNKISLNIANENLVKADLEDFIARWFLNHMVAEDNKLAAYVKAWQQLNAKPGQP